MKKGSSRQRRGGFSLIEVMVATAILMVIVLMIGGVFRQSSSAWDVGYARAEGGMIVRGVIGSIQRELSRAVDGRIFGGVWSHDGPVEVTDTTLAFICYKEGSGTGDAAVREPHLIEYKWTGSKMERHDSVLVLSSSGGAWSAGPDNPSVVYSEEDSDSAERRASYSADFEFEANEIDVGSSDPNEPPTGVRSHEVGDFAEEKFWNIPSVRIRVTLTRTGSFSGLEVRSYGPNGVEDADAETKDDDIVTM